MGDLFFSVVFFSLFSGLDESEEFRWDGGIAVGVADVFEAGLLLWYDSGIMVCGEM
jgi:hypothetical protein